VLQRLVSSCQRDSHTKAMKVRFRFQNVLLPVGHPMRGGHWRNLPMRDGRSEDSIENFRNEKFI
jgi:hypothetical protein